ncbi:MAG TPA: alpha/beta hydrolase [Candidatus Saccharimonadales bacterium]|nr:alpha/beta hydrolase [Candidatus Saccharimonadales bacterium]
MQIVVNQLMTRYDIAGKGKTVLLLHGWGDNLDGLRGLQNALATHYKVISLDLPGFGHTQAPPSVWNLDDYATFVAAFLQKIGLTSLAGLVGHSNGGALAIRAVSLGVLSPQKLVLLAASGIRTTQSSRRMLLSATAKIGKGTTFWLPERYRRILRQRLYTAAGSDMLVVPHLQETFKVTVRQDVQADAATITLPTLLVYAKDDRAVPVADGETYHKLITNSELHTLPGGHFVHLEHADTVAKAITEFLR